MIGRQLLFWYYVFTLFSYNIDFTLFFLSVSPLFYSMNLLMLAKCLLKLNNQEKAVVYLKQAVSYPIKTADDRQVNLFINWTQGRTIIQFCIMHTRYPKSYCCFQSPEIKRYATDITDAWSLKYNPLQQEHLLSMFFQNSTMLCHQKLRFLDANKSTSACCKSPIFLQYCIRRWLSMEWKEW